MNNTTPYQGTRRQFGYFMCKMCNKRWESGNSWANIGQKCKKCLITAYPFKQQNLEQSTSHGSRTSVPHPKGLCGKCIKLGHACNSRYFR